MRDESDWDRIGDLFERLLESDDPETAAASEPDPAIREAALNLWRHHLRAKAENYLASPMEFAINPIFEPGQTLLNRFRIERMLGAGGMGEVYLAWDSLLQDRVALKTIARLLAPSESIRRRFAAEVQTARRVTHDNVCRIHDLFEDGETIFFSMKYLEGVLLSDLLEKGVDPKETRPLVLQMAQGLHAAHTTGVVHGDFKPGNVIVTLDPSGGPARAVVMDFGLARALDRAGTPGGEGLSVRAGSQDYMAPELQSGTPTVRSDIYAFGKVALQILPGDRLCRQCASQRAEDRPDTLAPVIRSLTPQSTRRYWLGGLAIVSGVAAVEALRTSQLVLPAGARVLVNGFHAAAEVVQGARLARSVLLHALQQSPRLQPIADRDLLPAVRSREGVLPLEGTALREVLSQFHANVCVDGKLSRDSGRYALDVRLLDATGGRSLAATAFPGAADLVALAEKAGRWVRERVGESTPSLAANPAEVSRYTSDIPEALQKYYQALDHYNLAEMGHAIPLLEEAVRLDPNFAQAHRMLGICINTFRRYHESYRELELAHQLAVSRNLPERERTAIELNFTRATEDPWKSVEAAKRNVTQHPEDARAHMALGQVELLAGNPADGVESSRKALALAPGDWMAILQLEDALVQAGQYSQALDEFQVARGRGVTSPWIWNGAAGAYLCLERYDEAEHAFAQEPPDASNTADLQGPNIMRGKLAVALAAMQEQRARARNPIEIHQANQYLCALQFALGQEDAARRYAAQLAELPAYPPMARRLAGSASWARRLGDDAALANVRSTAGEIARRWPNALTQSVESHVAGLQVWRAGSMDEAKDQLLNANGSAFGIWTLFDLAELYMQRREWDLAETYWNKFEANRGTVTVKVWCPAMLVIGWLYRATAALARNDRATAYRYSGKVLDHWGTNNPNLRVVREAGNIHAVTKPI